MAYDLNLAERIRAGMQGVPFIEKKIFGGVGFIVQGNLACGVHKEDMVVRVNPAKHASLLKRNHVKPFAISGRPMQGWLLVEADGCKTSKQLSTWINTSIDFALTLPPK
jgi:hypothetical protein